MLYFYLRLPSHVLSFRSESDLLGEFRKVTYLLHHVLSRKKGEVLVTTYVCDVNITKITGAVSSWFLEKVELEAE